MCRCHLHTLKKQGNLTYKPAYTYFIFSSTPGHFSSHLPSPLPLHPSFASLSHPAPLHHSMPEAVMDINIPSNNTTNRSNRHTPPVSSSSRPLPIFAQDSNHQIVTGPFQISNQAPFSYHLRSDLQFNHPLAQAFSNPSYSLSTYPYPASPTMADTFIQSSLQPSGPPEIPGPIHSSISGVPIASALSSSTNSRKRIPPEKTLILENAFQENPKPDKDARTALANKTDLPIRNIQVCPLFIPFSIPRLVFNNAVQSL